jgi:hypothetical protein
MATAARGHKQSEQSATQPLQHAGENVAAVGKQRSVSPSTSPKRSGSVRLTSLTSFRQREAARVIEEENRVRSCLWRHNVASRHVPCTLFCVRGMWVVCRDWCWKAAAWPYAW